MAGQYDAEASWSSPLKASFPRHATSSCGTASWKKTDGFLEFLRLWRCTLYYSSLAIYRPVRMIKTKLIGLYTASGMYSRTSITSPSMFWLAVPTFLLFGDFLKSNQVFWAKVSRSQTLKTNNQNHGTYGYAQHWCSRVMMKIKRRREWAAETTKCQSGFEGQEMEESMMRVTEVRKF